MPEVHDTGLDCSALTVTSESEPMAFHVGPLDCHESSTLGPSSISDIPAKISKISLLED